MLIINVVHLIIGLGQAWLELQQKESTLDSCDPAVGSGCVMIEYPLDLYCFPTFLCFWQSLLLPFPQINNATVTSLFVLQRSISTGRGTNYIINQRQYGINVQLIYQLDPCRIQAFHNFLQSLLLPFSQINNATTTLQFVLQHSIPIVRGTNDIINQRWHGMTKSSTRATLYSSI